MLRRIDIINSASQHRYRFATGIKCSASRNRVYPESHSADYYRARGSQLITYFVRRSTSVFGQFSSADYTYADLFVKVIYITLSVEYHGRIFQIQKLNGISLFLILQYLYMLLSAIFFDIVGVFEIFVKKRVYPRIPFIFLELQQL